MVLLADEAKVSYCSYRYSKSKSKGEATVSYCSYRYAKSKGIAYIHQ
jgi:hypothetical protein